MRGAQGESLNTDHTVVAEPKHFAGHGSPEGGTNTSPVHIGERELRTVMLKSFEPAIREGHAMGVMAAYHEIDGIPMTADPFLLKKILREEWGFQGFVLSDLGAIQRAYTTSHHVAATPQGRGMHGHPVRRGHAVLRLRSRRLSEGAHRLRARRARCRRRIWIGRSAPCFASSLRSASSIIRSSIPRLNAQVHRSPEHLALSLESARESMTLLKNDGHLLPLSKSIRHIAVIGPNGDVARYGDYEKESNGERISMLDGIRALLPQATVTFDDGKDIAAAVAAAKDADVVILGLGEWQGISGEGFDRSNLDLPGNQEQLLEAVVATGKPVVLVLENGQAADDRLGEGACPRHSRSLVSGRIRRQGHCRNSLRRQQSRRSAHDHLSAQHRDSCRTSTTPIRRGSTSTWTTTASRCFPSDSA